MADLDIELDNDMIDGIKRLAVRCYSDSSDASIGRMAEVALEMRLLWQDRVRGGTGDIEEPLANWEFSGSPIAKENGNGIRSWLFRRR